MLDAGQVVRSTIRHSLVVIPVHVLVAGEQEPEGSGWNGIRLPRGLPVAGIERHDLGVTLSRSAASPEQDQAALQQFACPANPGRDT